MKISVITPYIEGNEKLLKESIMHVKSMHKPGVELTHLVVGGADIPLDIDNLGVGYLKLPLKNTKSIGLYHYSAGASYAAGVGTQAILFMPMEYRYESNLFQELLSAYSTSQQSSVALILRDIDLTAPILNEVDRENFVRNLHIGNLCLFERGFKFLSLFSSLPTNWWGFEASVIFEVMREQGATSTFINKLLIKTPGESPFDKRRFATTAFALQAMYSAMPGEIELVSAKTGASRMALERGLGFRRSSNLVDDAQTRKKIDEALAFSRQNKLLDAVTLLDPLYKANPQSLVIANVLMGIYNQQGRLRDAESIGFSLLRNHPTDPNIHQNIGNTLLSRMDFMRAVRAYKTKMYFSGESAATHANIGVAYQGMMKFEEAVKHYNAVLRLDPNNVSSAAQRIHSSQHLCDWSTWNSDIAYIKSLIERQQSKEMSPFGALSLPLSSKLQLDAANQFAKKYEKSLEQQYYPTRKIDLSANRKIRIGYLSADFFEHATLRLMIQMFESHSRDSFEWFAYSSGPDDKTPLRARAVKAFDHFVDISQLDQASAAKKIFDDGIDILVDLKGYTRDAKLEILGYRPAPVIMQYIGFPGTMGMQAVDYVIADKFVIPKHATKNYSEKVVWLPNSYQPNDSTRPVEALTDRSLERLPKDKFIFASFNQPYKIMPYMFKAWMDILKSVDNSVLWLYVMNNVSAQNLIKEAEKSGVAKDRLFFATKKKPHEHLSRIALADLVLDTHPYNAHTTASDSLWMGVPVITYSGETFASRVAKGLLSTVGLSELCFDNLDDYVRSAISLANDRPRLEKIKAHLSDQRTKSSLWDAKKLALHLESAYKQAFELASHGKKPKHIEVISVE